MENPEQKIIVKQSEREDNRGSRMSEIQCLFKYDRKH